jgi:hypothetical protein
MDHFDKIMENISQEILKTLKQMHKTRDAEERKIMAETVHQLSMSLSSLMESTATLMSEFAGNEIFDELD